MAQHITSAQIKCSAAALRAYLGATANLTKISDPDLDLEVLNAPETIAEGALIEFRISAYGFKQRMQHKYTEVSETDIVAEQTDGPTRAWKHRQTITAVSDNECTLTDQIDFEPPGGMLGYVMTAAKIKDSIQDGMDYRYETLQEIMEA
ncbi:MAG: hypothetical protein WAO83_07630 [Fuerstiella sp.]